MKKGSLSVAVALLMAFGLTTLPSLAHANGWHEGPRTVKVKERYVGNSLIAMVMEFLDGKAADSAVVNHGHSMGRWGTSETRSLSRIDWGSLTVTPDCFDGQPGLLFQTVQYDFQTTYSDLSSIHGTLAGGELCASLADLRQTLWWVEGNVVGGTGRFAGATGVQRTEGKTTQFDPGRFGVSEATSVTVLTLP